MKRNASRGRNRECEDVWDLLSGRSGRTQNSERVRPLVMQAHNSLPLSLALFGGHRGAPSLFNLSLSPLSLSSLSPLSCSLFDKVGVQDMVRQDDRFDHISGKIFKGLQSAFEQVSHFVLLLLLLVVLSLLGSSSFTIY